MEEGITINVLKPGEQHVFVDAGLEVSVGT